MTTTAPPAAPDTTGGPLELTFACAPRINLALQQNDIPIIGDFAIGNVGDTRVESITVRIVADPPIFAPWSTRIDALDPGTGIRHDELNLRLLSRRLRAQTEREAGVIRAQAYVAGELVLTIEHPVEILAFNEWGGLVTPLPLLCAFVLPNQTGVTRILQAARVQLNTLTGTSAIDGYQSGDRQQVAAIASSIYTALDDLGITYSNPPASFEEVGQKIRLPDQLLADQMGTCLDITVVLAACLEQAGLNPFLCVIHGHALPGVWLDEWQMPEPYEGGPLAAVALRKRVDAGEALVFDSSAAVSKVDFGRACQIGRNYLVQPDRFIAVIDVKRSRMAQVRPLPLGSGQLAEGSSAESVGTKRAPTLPSVPKVSPRQPAPDRSGTKATRLSRWKSKLLDLSLRNRLLNVSLGGKGLMRLFVADIAGLEDALAAGEAFAIGPRPDVNQVAGGRSARLIAERTGVDPMTAYLAAEYQQNRLVVDQAPAELAKRLKTLSRSATSALQETGASPLYLAMGLLAWVEVKAKTRKLRYAPIVLLPIRLVRANAREPYHIRAADDDPRINVTLMKKLEADFGIDVRGLDALPQDASGLDLPRILAAWRQAIMAVEGWEVVEAVGIGEFSFAKHLMWLDLEDRTEDLMGNALFAHIMEGNGEAFPLKAPFATPAQIDRERKVRDDLCVVDADSSQLAAIFAAKDGNSFVLQGPPGTGKSQTITNLIAQLLGVGKTVLFVSEKRAALEVVHSRLSKVGLGPFCLELHSNKANKKQVLDQIAQSFQLGKAQTQADWQREAAELQRFRDALNDYVEALHAPGPYGETVFHAVARRLELADAPEVKLRGQAVGEMSADRVHRLRERFRALEIAARDIDSPTQHPWADVRWADWSPRGESQVRDALAALDAAAAALVPLASAAANALGMDGVAHNDAALALVERIAEALLESPSPPAGLLTATPWHAVREDVAAARTLLETRATAWDSVSEIFRPEVLELDLATVAQKLGRFAMGTKRALKRVTRDGRLPPEGALRLALEQAREVVDLDAVIAGKAEAMSAMLGRSWQGAATDWDELDRLLDWSEGYRELVLDASQQAGCAGAAERLRQMAVEGPEVLAERRQAGKDVRAFRGAWTDYRAKRAALRKRFDIADGSPLARRLGELSTARAQLQAWQGALRQLRSWSAWVQSLNAVDDVAVADLVRAHAEGTLPGPQVGPAFERALATWSIEEAVGQTPALRTFRGTSHQALVTRFMNLDKGIQKLAQREIRARLAAKVPSLHSGGEIPAIKLEMKKKRGHLPIRRLFQKIPKLLMTLKPCVLMSPLSVAQYLDPALDRFDVVVFDEASQMPPWDAIGAIARGKQLIVVGDSKQLPPTAFFQKGEEDPDAIPDDDDLVEMESILDECVRSGFLNQSLKWHYRSRHEALIAFSNHHYYENKLNTFPAADHEVAHLGVKWRHVPDGFFDRGKSRTNQAEAEAIVAEIERWLSNPVLSTKSLGVVTFSQAQQQLIWDLLDELRQRRVDLERFFSEGHPEPVFVKNLENVQGDERDVIMFSISYGPDKAGKLAMNFGPLNRDGGERRLNVAITRARDLLLVFSTLTPDQIDLARTSAVGVTHLKNFLDYARRGQQAIASAVSLGSDGTSESPFERAVHRRLLDAGWQVDQQVGCAGYRIDLAVKDPDVEGSYLLGVECDGATYHSARCARDRDRIRQGVMESLGWGMFRVWSLDWWYDENGVMERLTGTLDEALAVARARRAEAAAAKSEAEAEAAAGAANSAEAEPLAEAELEAVLAEDPHDALDAVQDALDAGIEVAPVEGPDLSNTDPALPVVEQWVASPAVEVAAPAPLKEPTLGEQPQKSAQTSESGTWADPDSAASPQTGALLAQMPTPEAPTTYVFAEVATIGPRADYDLPESIPAIARLLDHVLTAEAPIHLKAATQRVGMAWGVKRVTNRSVAQLQRAILRFPPPSRPQLIDEFLWPALQEPMRWKGCRPPEDADQRRDPAHIPVQEAANAAAWLMRDRHEVELDDLVRELARFFGFASTGKHVRAVMTAGVELFLERLDFAESETATDANVVPVVGASRPTRAMTAARAAQIGRLHLPDAVVAALDETERAALVIVFTNGEVRATDLATAIGRSRGRIAGFMQILHLKLHKAGAARFETASASTGEPVFRYAPPEDGGVS